VHVRHLGFRTTQSITALPANTTISQPILQNLTATGVSTFTGNVSVSGTSTFAGNVSVSGEVTGNVNFDSNTLFVDSVGNKVGIGTASPSGPLDVYTASNTDAYVRGGNAIRLFLTASTYDWKIASNYYETGGLQFVSEGTIVGAFDQSQNFKFNSGYGSAAIAYGCRAWVNFNGQGTVAIREDGNVSSITDNGTGDYTVNFTTAMPDANYSAVGMVRQDNSNGNRGAGGVQIKDGADPTASALRILTAYGSTDTSPAAADDVIICCISIFR
jgi:hypothetical protein